MPSFHEHHWEVSYKTSDTKADGTPVDILHDFYIPVLRCSVRYDRVAGYFRSSSLAAASQGFSAFTGNNGKMRLVVGCDLNPLDIAVILQGGEIDVTKAGEVLVEELGEEDDWPEDVLNGVQLLGWMLAKEHLELKVAFRVHSKTGDPITVDSTEDGYVHEKWALFYDNEDDCLLIEGSLNESRTALSKNAENISVNFGKRWSDKHEEAVQKNKESFERIWNDESPALRVMTLPDAAKQKLLKIAAQIDLPKEIDGTSAIPPEVPPPDPLELLKFAIIRDAPKMPGGRYVGMYTAPIEPWPHQEIVARRLIESWPYNWLLCDEVGLGKTIESGLAVRSLHLSGLAKRVLIASPASVSRQWQRELASKFLLPFNLATTLKYEKIYPFEETRWDKSVFDEDLVIVSTALMSRDERRKELKAADKFDIALVDEAHYARRSNIGNKDSKRVPGKYNRLLETLRSCVKPQSSSLWLATATPMQLDPIEVSDLLTLTDRVGAFQFDPRLTDTYYEAVGKLIREAQPTIHEWELLRRAIASVERTDPLLWCYLKDTVVDAPIRMAVKLWLEKNQKPKGADLRNIPRFVFASAPLSRVMMRHTRSLLEVYKSKGQLGANLARRNILPVPALKFTPQEKTAYDQLEVYCDQLKKQIEKHSKDKGKRTAMGFYLSFLRLRFASSLYAIQRTIGRRLKRVKATLAHLNEEKLKEGEALDWDLVAGDAETDDEEIIRSFLKDRTEGDLKWEIGQLEKMVVNLKDLSGPSSKMQELFDRLNKRRDPITHRVEQTVIFSRFFDTVKDIQRRLRLADSEMLIGTYSGQGAGGQYVDPGRQRLVNVDREVVKRKFMQQEIDVLICTDAAAEGLNLQTADLLVNFDLPWNPMKVEQRIGRIDRIGQKHKEIYVLNLCYPDSAEQFVYGRLLSRLHKAGSVVGQQQVSMLPITPEEFQELAGHTLDPKVLQQKAELRMDANRMREQSMQMPPKEMYSIYSRLSKQAEKEARPVTLEGIRDTVLGSEHLRALGCHVEKEGAGEWLSLRNIDGIKEGASLTTVREFYDSGLPSGAVPAFASYGDPVFSALLKYFEEFEMPPCIMRIRVRHEQVDAESVAYLIAVTGESGAEVRMVTTLSELSGVQLDLAHEIDQVDVSKAEKKLRARNEAEFQTADKVGRIESTNCLSGNSQRDLDLMVALNLITVRAQYEDEDAFWPLVTKLDEFIDGKNLMTAHVAPLPHLHRIKGNLLFDVTAPKMGETGHLDAPRFLLRAALDAACRIAESTHSKKSECTVESIVSRIEAELKKSFRSMNQ